MPRGMSREAKRYWRETVELLSGIQDLLTLADGSMLAAYCEICAEEYAIMRAIDSMTRRKTRELKDGLKKMDPKTLAANKDKLPTAYEISAAITDKYANRLAALRNQKKVFGREFGLSPSARRGIMLPGGGRPAVEDPLDTAFYGGGPKLVKL